MSQSNNNHSVLVPDSILTASRCEHSDLSLHIEGNLPDEIQGHFFMVAPVGSVDSGGLPYPSGDSLLNGDGMIYRLDFDQPGKVKVKTKLVKPPDYYADKASRAGSQYAQYGFKNYGITRFSLPLGFRNQLNTAFLPMPFPNESQQRLLVTYDGGRPYEIDTETLEVATPIGANQEWRAEVDLGNFPFPPFLSTAHPAFDGCTGTLFTVNYSRSIENFLQAIPLAAQLEKLPQEIENLVASITGFFSAELLEKFFQLGLHFSQTLIQYGIDLFEQVSGIKLDNFVYLIRWQGSGNLERWKVILPDGSPVIIKQTIHQIGVTKDYVILMDTSFVTGVEQLLNNPFPEHKPLEETLRELLEKAETPDSAIYIISRENLQNGQQVALGEPEKTVVAQPLTIPMEAAHFLTDYDNPDGHITLHIAHICAWDVAEWIRKYDISPYEGHSPVSSRVHSMEVNEMDVSRLGRYIIDGKNGELISSQVIHETPATWGTGLYAYLDRLPSGKPPAELDNIYWSAFGLWEELMTQFGVELFQNYQYRAIAMDEVLELAKQGVPSSLLRVNTKEMVIVDQYQFPEGYIGSSPQFIPRRNADGSSTAGYLVCTVFTPQGNEFWVFDGENLSQGRLCRLFHPSLNFGFSLHTTWLPTIGKREASYNIPVNLDYERVISEQSDPMIRELFEQKVYPHSKD